MNIEEFGFTKWFRDQVDSETADQWKIARVTAVHKGQCDISDGEEMRAAKTTGHLRHASKNALGMPTVGDWVRVKNLTTKTSPLSILFLNVKIH